MDVRNPRREIGIGISALAMKPIPNATRLADQYFIRYPPDDRLLDETTAQKQVIGHSDTWLMAPATRQDLDAHWSRAGKTQSPPWFLLEGMTTDTLFRR